LTGDVPDRNAGEKQAAPQLRRFAGRFLQAAQIVSLVNGFISSTAPYILVSELCSGRLSRRGATLFSQGELQVCGEKSQKPQLERENCSASGSP